jgi:NADH dehydrogenase [ubiquinone] 1 alpha subcomplex assembly factor 7
VNALAEQLLSLIRARGPITVAHYMQAALGDPTHGYYMRGDPFGRDFVTAPEVSQMFGELIGLFFVQAWEDQGRPDPFPLVELGPGRGTLMADMMRAAAKVAPAFVSAAEIVLVETSPALREVQARTLSQLRVRWTTTLPETVGAPLFLVANEFVDALPIRQFVRSRSGWHERMVSGDGERLRFAATPEPVPEELIPSDLRNAAEGSVFETNPAARSLMREIAARIAQGGGLALLIDYGHSESATGDTLQAVKAHSYCDVLADPGEADLTAHVDFAALKREAEAESVAVCGPMSQGAFLDALGIAARAERLKLTSPTHGDEIDAALARLTAQGGMGALFKAMAVTARSAPPPPGFPC